MFDNRSVNIQQPQRIIHEEKRAPTDESIRLAIELEEKILKKIIDKFHCNHNILKISFFSLHDILAPRFICKIVINDIEYSKEICGVDFEKIIEDITYWVSSVIVKPVINDIHFELQRLCVGRGL